MGREDKEGIKNGETCDKILTVFSSFSFRSYHGTFVNLGQKDKESRYLDQPASERIRKKDRYPCMDGLLHWRISRLDGINDDRRGVIP